MPDIGLILLAAGTSSRLGRPKQLLEYQGKPLIRHAALNALGSSCRPVAVVLGAFGDAIQPVLQDLPVEIVHNPRWASGVGTSIHAGIAAMSRHNVRGAILCLADQPLVSPDSYDRLVNAYLAGNHGIIASAYSDTVGVPVLFDRSLFPHLAELPDDKGCKGVILGHPDRTLQIPCPEAETDIDCQADVERVLAR